MPDTPSRRAFLLGVLSCGALTAAATYFTPGGKPTPPVRLRLVTGADTTGGRKLLFDMWNAANPETQVDVIVVEGQTADQHKRMSDAAESGDADVLNLDVINIPEFAGRGLISRIELSRDRFLGRTLEAGQVSPDSGQYWAAPFNTDVGMLFERVVPGAIPDANPRLATALDSVPAQSQGFVGQVGTGSSASDEAFMINVLEHALSRDAGILDGSGIPIYELRRWTTALEPLRRAVDTGRIRQADNETTSVNLFITEPRPRYMRNWPVYYRELQQRNDPDAQQGRILVRPLPIGILGGQSLAVAARSRHQARARQLIDFLTSDEAQKILAAHGLAPTRVAAYSDPNLRAFIPHLEHVRLAVESARPRPVHPNYGDFATTFVRHMRSLLSDGVELPSKFIDDIRNALPGTG